MGAEQACCCSNKEPDELNVNRPSRPGAMPGNPDFSQMGHLEKLDKVAPTSPLENATPPPDLEERTVKWDDGSMYVGQMRGNKKHGFGRWEAAGADYEGEWQDDSFHGQGRQTWTDGRVFEGQFERGCFSGRGKMTWKAQNGVLVYEGEYRDDMKQGRGKFQWADGRAYDGEWHLGKRHGRGVYTNSQLEQRVGYWRSNQWERWEEEDEDRNQACSAPGAEQDHCQAN